ncbi:hypothetical protein OpiT1DRAFT_02994 [Opitutaceae bacterium TAV1]|nr:hypothetical protein OpiT1DRAFT_02994 [Opitutaceae bacterium TAV1]
MKTFLLCLLAGLPASFVAAQSAPAGLPTNLVRNGGFEADADGNGYADDWFVHPGNAKAVAGGRQWLGADGAAEGRAFLRTSKTGGQAAYMVSSYLPDSLIPRIFELREKPLVLRAKMRGEELTDKAGVIVQIFARKAGADRDHFVTNLMTKPVITGTIRDWTEVKVSFRLGDLLLPEDTLTRLEIVLSNASNTGHADFDAVTLAFEN